MNSSDFYFVNTVTAAVVATFVGYIMGLMS